MEGLIPAPADCEMQSVIKFLNTWSIARIKINRQLYQQSFATDFLFFVAQNYHRALVVQTVMRQVGVKATDSRPQSKAEGVSIDNCGPSFLHLKKL